jgi:hypothetical protein
MKTTFDPGWWNSPRSFETCSFAVRRLVDRVPHALFASGMDPNELEIAFNDGPPLLRQMTKKEQQHWAETMSLLVPASVVAAGREKREGAACCCGCCNLESSKIKKINCVP